MTLDDLLAHVRQRNSSDLHLVAGQPPVFRSQGHLERRDGDPPLTTSDIESLLAPYLSERNLRALDEERRDADVAVRSGGRRFRTHVHRDSNGLGAAIRIIPNQVPTLAELGLSEADGSLLPKLTRMSRGLVLITGPLGSGKTTTAAAMLEEINRTRAERIITVEDPIEYEFEAKLSLISQRNVGEDISDHPAGLRAALNMDVDVVLVDRLRDLETILLTLSLAENGHLVFATMNAPTASEAVFRLIESFPEAQRPVMRDMLSRNLQAVIAQMLLPRASGQGRVPAQEILIGSPRMRQMIAAGQNDLSLAMEAGHSIGMQTFDDAIIALFEKGVISEMTARSRLSDKSRLPFPAAEGTA